MSSIAKYGFIIFVFNSILLSVPEMKNIGDFIFFGLMFMFSIYAIVNSSILIQIFKSKSVQFLILIIFGYQITFLKHLRVSFYSNLNCLYNFQVKLHFFLCLCYLKLLDLLSIFFLQNYYELLILP